MPFLICSNCKKYYLSKYLDIHGRLKLCYTCVQQWPCDCRSKFYVTENCNKHYSTPKDQQSQEPPYEKSIWRIFHGCTRLGGDEIHRNPYAIRKEVASLKITAIKCLYDNHVRVENKEEEYFYKRVIPNHQSLF